MGETTDARPGAAGGRWGQQPATAVHLMHEQNAPALNAAVRAFLGRHTG